MRRMTTGLLVLVMAVSAASCSSDYTPIAGGGTGGGGSSALPAGHFGDRLRVPDPDRPSTADVTVSSPQVFHSRGFKPKGTFYEVTVLVEGVSGTTHVNPFDWQGRTGDGTQLDPYLDSSLKDADVAAGQRVTGTLEFDVPDGQSLDLVVLSDFDQLASWSTAG